VILALSGSSVGSGAEVFRAVPYAAPSTKFAASCPQHGGLFAPPGGISEDCLCLNVHAPAPLDRRSRRPILGLLAHPSPERAFVQRRRARMSLVGRHYSTPGSQSVTMALCGPPDDDPINNANRLKGAINFHD
jgi:hypothetical protein